MENPLTVLQETVIQKLERGIKGSKFPTMHNYFDGVYGHDNVPPEKIPALKEEFLQINKSFCEGMELISPTVTVRVPTHNTGYSPLLGVPVEKDSYEAIGYLLNESIDQCTIAIILNCGFGKYSALPEKLREAMEQLKDSIEKVSLTGPKGVVETLILAYDSNNNIKHGKIVEGMWIPYRVIGLVLVKESILGFDATMDYGTGVWKFNKFGFSCFLELVERSFLFSGAYKKITGKNYNQAEIQKPEPGLVNWLTESKAFHQNISRVCKRWTN
ncbi:MAG: hypothetical protein Q8P63_00105 [Candidatus Nealsonbacteria bacterium]|nr:hypothetical protein [Candidatus Nealsonbacteria bacterium]